MNACFVIPYFGKYPNYFDLFLKSCSYNKDFEWIIFSDIKDKYEYPSNVQLVYMSFDEIKTLFQSKFDFTISLDTPYKLCDYKPAYGYVFEKYLQEYDYWGYCDIDLLFGNLNHFINAKDMVGFDKIGHLGHMTLYRNEKKINELFMQEINGRFRYKEVFSTKTSCVFDEWDHISINHIFRQNDMNILYFEDFFDVYPYDDNFKRVRRQIPNDEDSFGKDIIDKKISYASWEEGSAYRWWKKNNKWVKSEVAYLHFQKRYMKKEYNDIGNNIFCVPDSFVSLKKNNISTSLRIRGVVHRLFNYRRFKWNCERYRYYMIEKTGPIRHFFRNKLRQ